MPSLKDQTAKGLLWGGLSNGLMQLLGAVFGIILLRLLTPDDYGKVAVLVIFSNVACQLQESGFIAALCNKKTPQHEDYNAVFWFGLLMSAVLYLGLFLAAPLIARFYHEPILTPLARYVFLGFFVASFGTVQHAYMFRRMMVKQIGLINLLALTVSNLTGILLAFMGYAYWGLATQSILYTAVIVLCKWYLSPWRPTWNVNLRPAWEMFGFSSKLLVTNLFGQLNSQVFSVLLGRFYNAHIVGYYSNARKWNDMASVTINSMVLGVAQPVLTQVMEDDDRYRQVFRKMLRFTSFITFPAMFGLALIAREFILLTVGDRWIESASLLTVLCVHGAFYPLTTLYSNMAISRGKSGINMFCMISICVLVWTGLILLRGYGLYTMVYFFVGINILWLLVWQLFAWRMVRLTWWCLIRDVLPFCLSAAGVMVLTALATRGIENLWLLISVKILLAAALYVGIMYLSGAKILRESIRYILHK